MDKEVARSLLSLAKSLDGVIGSMFAEVDKITNERLKSQFNKAVGDLMGYVARDLIFPIESIYPDLRIDD
jgi:hypothetical protein